MATTNIELDIENITGVSDADDQFVKSAQKFVVSSIPKNLMLWAGTSTAVASHGGDSSPTAITLPQPTDNILDVSRNGYSAEQVPESLQGFISNSSSLHYATEIYPKYFIQAGNKVIVKPDPSDSETALVNYVDFLKIDDDCDLRNAVIFHAASKEFSQLATDNLPTWSSPSIPVSPATPDFGADLTISKVAPVAPTSPSFTYTDASVSDMIKPIISISDMAAMTVSTPSYTQPVLTLTSTPTIADLSISASLPVIPSLSSNSVSFSATAPTYSAPVLEARKAFSSYSSGLSETDPGTFGIVSSPPAVPSAPSYTTPAISSVNISNVGVPPSYTPPVIGGDATELSGLSDLDVDNTIDTLADQKEWDQWFATAAHLIEDEEDTELASIQIQKISAYVSAYSQAMQNQLNEFNESNAEYQAKLQEAIQQAQINAQEAQQESNLLLQQENQEFAASLQRYSAQVQSYQTVVSKEVQEYQQKLAQYQLELSTSVQAWQNEESHKLSIHQSNLQDSLNTFNKENAEYQAQLQVSIQNAQLSSQDDAQNLQKYSAELQAYKDDVEKQVHNYTNSLQKNIKEYESKLALYNSNVQKYASEVGEIVQKSTLATQNAAYYSKEAEKYYNWAKLEVNSYVQNNSKMIRQTMAAQAAQQRA